MITTDEYLKAKKIVEEYEEQQYQDGMNNAMYCVSCQALNHQECFCDEEEDEDACLFCNGSTKYHSLDCITREDDET